MSRAEHGGFPLEELRRRIKHERNIVLEMVVELRAVKPARLPLATLRSLPIVTINMVDQ